MQGSICARSFRSGADRRQKAGGFRGQGECRSSSTGGGERVVVTSEYRTPSGETIHRRRIGSSDTNAVGPQGAALILELQRLRDELERVDDTDRPQTTRSVPESRSPRVNSRASRPKRHRKGGVGRAIVSYLGQL